MWNIFRKIVENNRKFVLTTHVNPDGDAIGCEVALFLFLEKIGREVSIINYSPTPKNYQFLDPSNQIHVFDKERDVETVLNADAIILLDMNHSNRLRAMEPFVLQSKAVKLVIDHHIESENFADYFIVDDEVSACGEIIYNLLLELNGKSLDKETASALYAAIMTDTGSFRFPKTSAETHRITARLIECGADPSRIYQEVYEGVTLGRWRLLGNILSSIRIAHDGRLAYIVVTREMFRETQTEETEVEGFVNYAMSVNGVLVGIIFIEVKNGVKISFRSKGDIPVNELAKEFGGNGHRNAAGARVFTRSLDDVVDETLRAAGDFLHKVLGEQAVK
jgi:phosphoesterase RecJ-like protein